MTDDRHAFLRAVEAYIERADQQDLEVLMDVLEAVLSDRLESYGGLVQASVRGLRDTIRRAHRAPHSPR